MRTEVAGVDKITKEESYEGGRWTNVNGSFSSWVLKAVGRAEDTKGQAREVGGELGGTVSGTGSEEHQSLWVPELSRLERRWHLSQPAQ